MGSNTSVQTEVNERPFFVSVVDRWSKAIHVHMGGDCTSFLIDDNGWTFLNE